MDENSSTELDIILSLLRFHKENQDLFTFIAKQHTHNKTKSIGTKLLTKQPIVHNNQPIYVDLATKRKE